MTTQVSIWYLLRRMISYARSLYLWDTLFWLLISGLPALTGLIIREFFNGLAQSAPTYTSPLWLVGLLLVVGLGRISAIVLGRITKTQHRFLMNTLIRHNLLQKLLAIAGAEALRRSSNSDRLMSVGEVISFFRDDASQIEDNVVSTNEVLGEGIFAIASLILLMSVNVQITLLIFLPLAIIAALVHQAAHRIKQYRRDSRQSTQAVTGLIGEIFASVQAIKVAGAESSTLQYFRKLSDHRRQMMVRDQMLTSVLDSSFDNLVSLGTGAILLFAAQSQPYRLKVGDFALFIYFLSYVTYFFSFLGAFLNLSKQSEVSFERMANLVKVPATELVAHHPLYLPSPELLQFVTKPSAIMPEIVSEPPSLAPPLQTLKAIDLTYQYLHTNQGICQVSLSLKRGSLTVVTGAIGAGKTTLLQLLMGLLPLQSGAIYWNSKKVNNPDQFFIPPQAAYTSQVPKLFSGSLRENILLGMPYGEDPLREAIALASFEQDLEAMPDRLDTQIGNKGMRLSGGQIQRIAAARMFIRQPELLVFDDLSSALDVNTEQTMWSRLFDLQTKGAWQPTYLVVSHRPSVLERADQIIRLDRGQMI